MITASVDLNSPVRPTVTCSFRADSALGRPAVSREHTPVLARAVDWEERRWQLEWERRNVED